MRLRDRDVSGCFGCDHANPGGLGMTFFRDTSGRLAASCTPGDLHRGLGQIINGGLVATFGEEVAAAAAAAETEAGLVVTRMQIKYERPAYVGTMLRGVVTSASREGKLVDVSVDISSGGTRVAVLDASFVLISEERLRQLAGIGVDQGPVCLVAGRQRLPIED
jgi:acyl-coenzyme A thioesterase PaaI-like protein